MKNSILILIAFFFSANLFAQNAQYISTMKTNISGMYAAKDIQTLQQHANVFERIATVEKEAWLPDYYQAYCYMTMARITMKANPEMLEGYLDKAQTAINAAKAKAPQESEIFVMQAFIYQGRIWPDPMSKGAEYSPRVIEACQTAMAMNDANPRAYYMQGQQTFHTPVFFGGGAEKALPWLEKAQEAFVAFKPASELHPMWGAESTDYLVKACQTAEASQGK